MAELADALDSNSSEAHTSCGFDPRLRHSPESAAGDRSTDFNFYTKRGLLAGVYAATTLYWLDDRSPGFEATQAFLDRRLADVMAIPRLGSRVREFAARLPDPFLFLRLARRR